LLAFTASLDIRELRGRIHPLAALFNRSQIALSVLAASAVFQTSGVSPSDWPAVLPVALLAFAIDACLNVAAVVVAGALTGRMRIRDALAGFVSEGGWPFLVGYVCYGLTALILAVTFEATGAWGLVAFLLPMVVSRQMFARGQMLAEASREAIARSQVLVDATERIAEERADERRRLAGALHDVVLPPLFKVHLMGEVLRRELDTGQLLAMDDDLPELLRATDAATTEVRSIIGNLRRSDLGADGLCPTLGLLLDDAVTETTAIIERDIARANASPLVQLIIYQVAREALTNAIRHANARRIFVRLIDDGGWIRLLVEDDGMGFALGAARRLPDHFGLRLMQERAVAIGGMVTIDSEVGEGTRVVGRFPSEVRLTNE
jgi:signal transduction histidine kinase